ATLAIAGLRNDTVDALSASATLVRPLQALAGRTRSPMRTAQARRWVVVTSVPVTSRAKSLPSWQAATPVMVATLALLLQLVPEAAQLPDVRRSRLSVVPAVPRA